MAERGVFALFGYNCAMTDQEQFQKKGLQHLRRIENELEDIKDRTGSPKRLFLNGMLYGAGAFVGGILAIILGGWLLSIAGFIPGFAEIADIINAAIQSKVR